MRILSLEIDNILSIEKATIQFEDSGLVLVEGWNHDTQRANGAGKTAIFNCLSYALYDKIPRKITASEILRRGSKSGSSAVTVLCGEDTWTVKRFRPKNVEFFKNGLKQDITQEEFESNIRLNYSQFLLTIYIPQANSGQASRFLATPDTNKKEFILQLLNLDTFKNCKTVVDNNIKACQASIDFEAGRLQSTRSKIEAYEESKVDTASLWKKSNDKDLLLKNLFSEITVLSNTQKPDLTKYSKIEDDIRIKQSAIAQAKAKRSLLHDRYRDYSAQVAEYDVDKACDACGSSLDNEQARISHAGHQDIVKQKMLDTKVQIDECDTIISKENGINDLARKLREKKNQESADYQAAQLRINELKGLLRVSQAEKDECDLKIANQRDLTTKISSLEAKCLEYVAVQEVKRKELDIYKALASIYSPTGAQAYVLDSVVDSFNEVIQKYIDIMSPNITYTLNSFKETAKGDVVAKFSETLVKGGTEVSVGSLSGGEEKGLSLCVDFALLEVLETQFGMTLNPIILDEPFDGLDAAGREIVINLLETLARTRQIFVVDHASEAKALFTKSIKVELKNDISVISIEL